MNRKIINVLTFLFVAFILYNTLIPFHFQMQGKEFGELVTNFETHFFVHEGRLAPLTDIAGNFLLFIPLGLLIYLWFRQHRIRGGVILGSIAGFCLSLTIEFLQLFIVERTSAMTDIIMNTAGTFFGAFFTAVYFMTISRYANQYLKKIVKEQPVVLILIVILLFQIVGSIIPFNVSITVSDLKKSLKNVNFFPFQNLSLGSYLFDSPTKFDKTVFNWYAFIENALFWAVWGYIASICLFLYWKEKFKGKIFYLFVLLFPPLLLEFMQFFIVSRFCDINDIISAWIGVLFGVFLYMSLRPHRISAHVTREIFLGAISIYFIFLLFTGLQPFDFNFSPDGPVRLLNHNAIIPFYSYFKKTSIWNIYDLINSLFYFIPISLYLSDYLKSKAWNWGSIYLTTGILGFSTGALIEMFQIFSSSRVAEITDSLLYATGGLLGTFIYYYFLQEIKPVLFKTEHH